MKRRKKPTTESIDPILDEHRQTNTLDAGISPEERLRWIAEAAYYHSQSQPSESQDPLRDWLQAERDIDTLIQSSPAQNPVKIDKDRAGHGSRHTTTVDPATAEPLSFRST